LPGDFGYEVRAGECAEAGLALGEQGLTVMFSSRVLKNTK
jgi:hypothetical protein